MLRKVVNMYLSNLPTEICNQTGLSKVLITRRETIRLKHLLKNLFVCNLFTQDDLVKKLRFMQFKDLFQYMEFLSNRLRGIYDYPRAFKVDNADKIVKQKNNEFTNIIRLYETANPIAILEFDRTTTNPKFHSLYRWLTESIQISVIINTENANKDAVLTYLNRFQLKKPKEICNNKGKQKYMTSLKNLVIRHYNRPIFYVDNEAENIEYANLLFCQSYEYTRRGKILTRTINKK